MLIDLSHTIDTKTVSYKGLPAPTVCDFWSREDSRANYDDGSEFLIARIDMVANTGTYVDCPFHRFPNGEDFTQISLDRLAHLPGVLVQAPFAAGLAVDVPLFQNLDVRGKAVLIATGWDAFWMTPAYYINHPYLTPEAAAWLRDNGAAVVGIDSHNIDDTRTRTRPVHTLLLGAGIPIVEHLCNLHVLADMPFHFTAAPPRFAGVGSFPVRAYAQVA